MVKSTIRFPETVVDEIETLVNEGHFESKSEFYRFAADYMLERIVDGYTPETIDFEEIKEEVLDEHDLTQQENSEKLPFFESLVIVRQYAMRGNYADAEDFIDHHYSAADRHALILEEVLQQYRKDKTQQQEQPANTPVQPPEHRR